MIWVFLISCLNLQIFPQEVRNYKLCLKQCIPSNTNATLFIFSEEKNMCNVIQFHSEASDEISISRYQSPFFLEAFQLIIRLIILVMWISDIGYNFNEMYINLVGILCKLVHQGLVSAFHSFHTPTALFWFTGQHIVPDKRLRKGYQFRHKSISPTFMGY